MRTEHTPESLRAREGVSPLTLRVGIPSTSLGALVCLWFVYAMNANLRQIFYYVIPPMVSEFKISPATIGIVSALETMACSLIAIPLGPWFDRGGHGWARKYRNAVVALGYFAFSIFTGIGGLTQSIWNIVILQGIKNAFGGAGEAIEVTSAVEWFPLERTGFALGWQHTAYPWGTLIGALATGAILAHFGSGNWRYVFLLVPLAMIPIWLAYWLYATPARYAEFERETKALALTKPLLDVDAAAKAAAAKGMLVRTMRNPNVMIPAICSCFGIMTYAGISFWLPQYLAFVAHYNFAEAAAYSAVFTITGGIGQFAWGWISDHIGRKTSLVITFIWLGLGLYLFQYSGLGLGWLVGVQLFAGLATNAIYPVLYAYVSDSAFEGSVGTANSIFITLTYLGGISPLLIGYLIQAGGGFHNASGYVYSLYFMVAAVVLSALLILLFTRETTGRLRGRDFGLVSLESCNVVAGHRERPLA